MARNILFDLRVGGGSSMEVLYGEIHLSPTLLHSVSTAMVLPTATKVDLIAGKATFTNVAPSPAPVDGQVSWCYKARIVGRYGKTFEYLVGVPDGTTEINFNVLPRYSETRPPSFGVGPAGPAGQSATIAIGSTTSGPTPAVTNTGTSTEAVLNFTLAKGDKGDTGAGVKNEYLGKLFTDTPTSYAEGATIGLYRFSDGWPGPANFVNAQTFRHSNYPASTFQIISPYGGTGSGAEVLFRKAATSETWGPLETFRGGLATPLMNGLMPALDKAKLDGMTPTANSKTFAAAASTYPSGFSTLQVRAADGWPLTTTGTLVTQKTASGNGGVGQWLYPVEGGAPLCRISDAVGNWGNFQTIATDSYVDNATAGVVKEVTSDETYYVSLTGSDSNDGLTEDAAFKTINKAVQQTQYKTYTTGVKTTINLSAGTYAESIRFDLQNATRRLVHLKGPTRGHPNVPTAIIRLSPGNTKTGLVIRDTNLQLTVEDIKFQDFRGNSSAAGIVVTEASLKTVNVHVEDCFWGITASRAFLDVSGGIFTNCGYNIVPGNTNSGAGIRSLMLTNHAIGTQYGSVADGPFFRSCQYGVLAQESSVGHVDYCTFEDNNFGLVARVNSRANAGGSVFKRNNFGVSATGASFVLISENSMGIGVDANKINYHIRSNATITLNTENAYIGGIDNSQGAQPRRALGDYTPIIHSGSSAYVYEKTLKAGFFDDENNTRTPAKKVIFKIKGRVSGSGDKTLRLQLGAFDEDANIEFTYGPQETGGFSQEAEFTFIGPGSQLIQGLGLFDGSPARIRNTTSFVDMSMDAVLRINVKTSAPGDTIRITHVEIYIEG